MWSNIKCTFYLTHTFLHIQKSYSKAFKSPHKNEKTSFWHFTGCEIEIVLARVLKCKCFENLDCTIQSKYDHWKEIFCLISGILLSQIKRCTHGIYKARLNFLDLKWHSKTKNKKRLVLESIRRSHLYWHSWC